MNPVERAGRRSPAMAGFGLVEIMVGLAIGMIATLVIVQVATTFEGQKRSTTGTADAQTSGSVALYTIQRQVQMAGYGLPVFSHQNQALNCAAEPTIDHDGNAATAEIGTSPVVITNGAGNGNDIIAVRMGGSRSGGIPLKISGVVSAANSVIVANNMTCEVPAVALISDGTNCVMKNVQALPTTTQIQLNSILSPDGTSIAPGIAIGSTIGCMGPWRQQMYEVSGTNLLENGVQIASGVVNMQARYGISLAGNTSQVSAWVDGAGSQWGSAMTAVDRNRIKAIRVAIVVRNGLLEKDDVTQACSSLTDNAPTGLCAWAGSVGNPAPRIDLGADANWRKYRYRVFETIIPVRNMIWSTDAL